MLLYRSFCRVGGKGFSQIIKSCGAFKIFHLCWKTETVLNRRELFISFAPFPVSTLEVFSVGPFVNIKHNHISKKAWFGSSDQLTMFSVGYPNHFLLCDNITIPLFSATFIFKRVCGRASEVSYLYLYLGSWNSSSLKTALIFWM